MTFGQKAGLDITEVNNLVFDSITNYQVWNLSMAFDSLEKFMGDIVSDKEVIMNSKSPLTLVFETAMKENQMKSKYFKLVKIIELGKSIIFFSRHDQSSKPNPAPKWESSYG